MNSYSQVIFHKIVNYVSSNLSGWNDINGFILIGPGNCIGAAVIWVFIGRIALSLALIGGIGIGSFCNFFMPSRHSASVADG